MFEDKLILRDAWLTQADKLWMLRAISLVVDQKLSLFVHVFMTIFFCVSLNMVPHLFACHCSLHATKCIEPRRVKVLLHKWVEMWEMDVNLVLHWRTGTSVRVCVFDVSVSHGHYRSHQIRPLRSLGKVRSWRTEQVTVNKLLNLRMYVDACALGRFSIRMAAAEDLLNILWKSYWCTSSTFTGRLGNSQVELVICLSSF